MPNPLQPTDFFVVRTPLLPLEALNALWTPTADRAEVRRAMQAIFRDPLVQEALYVASVDLYQTLDRWLTDADMTDKEREKLDLSYAKYLLRMAHRPTPFGLFAGLAVGEWRDQTNLRRAERAANRRHSRLDMDCLGAMVQQLTRQPGVRDRLRYQPNNTLYRVGSQYRYTEYRFTEGGRSHHLATVAWSGYLQTVLNRAETGATLADLRAVLVSDDITPDEAQDFLNQLIDSKILVSELEPRVTDPANLERLVQTLSQRAPDWPGLPALSEVIEAINRLDASSDANQAADYEQIVAQLRAAGFTVNPARLLQVDCLNELSARGLNRGIVDDLNRGVGLLADIARLTYESPLEAFRQAFAARYEGQEVPLLDVLDTEIGLGYPLNRADASDNAPLLATFSPGPAASGTSVTASAWDSYALKQHTRLVEHGLTEWVLDETDLRTIVPEAGQPPLPPSLYVMARLLASSAEALDAGDYQVVLQGTGGPSAANLLGRFTHVDAELAERTRHLLADEQARTPELLAEIVYLPPARVGNVQLRERLRPYEIPILAAPSAQTACTLPLHDLRLSVRGNRLVLRSQRLNREVVPRLSTAHNYAYNAIPAYHFLCDLQRQTYLTNLNWSWGSLLNQADYWPRVRLGRVILYPATWRLRTADLFPTDLPDEALLAHLREIRQRRKLPRRVVFGEADNQLPIDLENIVSVRVLRGLVRHVAQFVVEESLVEPGTLLIRDSADRGYTNEFVFPLRYVPEPNPRPAAGPPAPAVAAVNVPRQFMPGSEWLYVKLYTGVKTADTLLTEAIGPLANQWLAQGLIDRWFFVRYADPDGHLRVRFHGGQQSPAPLLAALHTTLKPYLDSRLLRTVQFDTYSRELERYGPATMAASETLFFHDSRAIVALLDLLDGDEGDTYRWQLALLSVDWLLDDWELTTHQKHDLMQTLAQAFAQEHQLDTPDGRVQFDTQYRRLRTTVDALVRRQLPPADWADALAILHQRSTDWQPVIREVQQAYAQEQAAVPFFDWLASHIHMTLNRWSRSRPRQQELIVYQLLGRQYRSMLARTRRAVTSPATP